MQTAMLSPSPRAFLDRETAMLSSLMQMAMLSSLLILLLRRGRLSVPGGATYLGKFNQGKPVGKGRLIDLTRKKEKGKFSSISEILNRYFVIELPTSFFQDVHQGLRCGCNIPRQGGHRRLCSLSYNPLQRKENILQLQPEPENYIEVLGKPKSRVFNLVGGGYYIGKVHFSF